MTKTVVDAQGVTHNFPDEATPEMMAQTLGVTYEPEDDDETAPAANMQPPKNQGPTSGISPLKDIIESGASGLARGAAETAMLPVTIPRLVNKGLDATVGRAANGLVDAIMGPPSAAQKTKADSTENPIYSAQDAIRGGLDSILHKPETTEGKYAGTIGEFAAPGGMFGKAGKVEGLANKAKALFGDVVVPALTSETAGEATEGTKFEPWARLVGALAGGGAVAAGRSMRDAPTKIVGEHFAGTTPEQLDAAETLARTSKDKFGLDLLPTETVSQVTGNMSPARMQQIMESTRKGGSLLGRFYADRPAQVDNALDSVYGGIAPATENPSSIGLATQSAANKAIDATPEGKALQEAIWGAGPRTTAGEAGPVIQDDVNNVLAHREGMRNALADQDYSAARAAPANLSPMDLRTDASEVVPASRTLIRPDTGGVTVTAPTKADPITLSSRTGANVQVDPRPTINFIDAALQDAKGTTATALNSVRSTLFDGPGADTSVSGLINAHGNLGALISKAAQDGDNATVAALSNVKKQLEDTLSSVPEYAQAQSTFKAASEPVAPFKSDPALAKITEKAPYGGGPALPPEQVAPTIEAGGMTGAKAFKDNAGPAAQESFENYLTTKLLNSATDAGGAVNADSLVKSVRNNADLLSQYPNVGKRLEDIIMADSGLAGTRNGPLGQIANTADTEAAKGVLFPKVLPEGASAENAAAAAKLAEQDGTAARQLVKQHISGTVAKNQGGIRSGASPTVGAAIAKDLAGGVGGKAQEINLTDILRAVGAEDAANDTPVLMEALRATGKRLGVGSNTAEKATTIKDLSIGNPASALAEVVGTGGIGLVNKVRDASNRAWLGINSGRTTNALMGDDAYDFLRDAIMREDSPVFRKEAGRMALTTAPQQARSKTPLRVTVHPEDARR